MDSNLIPFYDNVSIKQYTVHPDLQNKFLDTILGNMEQQENEKPKDEVNGLLLKSIVTHAGRLTGHYHYYAPGQVERGTDSFLLPYFKPWLINHNTDADPIGRIKEAKYVSTPPVFLSDAFMRAVQGTSVHNKKSLSYMKTMRPYLYDSRFQGLGYVDVLANITDEDAIKKVLDGRYQTISIGYDTDSLHCSECLQDFISEGNCDHQPGKMYDKGKMFLIFGNMKYREASFVNVPADDMAAVVGAKRISMPMISSLRDSISSIKDKEERIHVGLLCTAADSVSLGDELRVPTSTMSLYTVQGDSLISLNNFDDNNSGVEMPKIKNLKAGEKLYAKLSDMIVEDKRLTTEQIAELQDSDFVGANRLFPVTSIEYIDAAKKYLENVEDSDEKAEIVQFLEARLTTLNAPIEPVVEPTTNATNESDLDVSIVTLMEKVIAGQELSDEESETLYNAMFLDSTDALETDAKLSTEARKNLKSGSFCGPNKSFPIPDKAHVVAARRMLSRYKGPGDKSKILACINAKAKKLGVDSIDMNIDFTFKVDSDMKVVKPVGLCSDAQNAIFKSLSKGEDYINYYFTISVSGSDDPCSCRPDDETDPEAEKKILELLLAQYAKEKDDAMVIVSSILAKLENKDEVIASIAKDQLEDLNSRIDNYKNESVAWNSEKDSLINTSKNLTNELRSFYVNTLVGMVDKQDPTKSVESLKEEFAKQTLSELRTSVDNISKILGDNITSKGNVANPSLSYNDNQPKGSKVATLEDIQDMRDTLKKSYITLRKKNSKYADEFLMNQTKQIDALEAQIKENK